MKIQPATLKDFPVLYELWQKVGLQLYPQPDEQQRYQKMLELNPEYCLVLKNEKYEILGSILGAFDGRTASIHRLAIDSKLQKQGWGKELVATLEKELKEKGIQKLTAQIHISNTQVQPFYEKLAFKEMTYVKNYYKDL